MLKGLLSRVSVLRLRALTLSHRSDQLKQAGTSSPPNKLFIGALLLLLIGAFMGLELLDARLPASGLSSP